MRLFVKWIVCCAAVLLARILFPASVVITGSWAVVFGMGTVLWIVNLFIRPIAQIVSILITLITFGIFSLIVNALMVRLADIIIPSIRIESFWICIFIALIISAGNAILAPKIKDKKNLRS